MMVMVFTVSIIVFAQIMLTVIARYSIIHIHWVSVYVGITCMIHCLLLLFNFTFNPFINYTLVCYILNIFTSYYFGGFSYFGIYAIVVLRIVQMVSYYYPVFNYFPNIHYSYLYIIITCILISSSFNIPLNAYSLINKLSAIWYPMLFHFNLFSRIE
jgi:hypothetical protein